VTDFRIGPAPRRGAAAPQARDAVKLEWTRLALLLRAQRKEAHGWGPPLGHRDGDRPREAVARSGRGLSRRSRGREPRAGRPAPARTGSQTLAALRSLDRGRPDPARGL